MSKEEDINVDDLRRWKQSSRLKVDGIRPPVTILHDEILPDMDLFLAKHDTTKKVNPFKERNLKKDHWDNKDEKSKTIINCREGDELKIYYPFDKTTGERLMNFWFTEDYNPTCTISGAIEIERDIKEWFFPKEYISISEEGKILRESMKDKYFVDIMITLAEKEGVTAKELTKTINITEQHARIHLNILENEGLLKAYRYNKGGKLYRFALSESKLNDIKIVLGLS